MSFNYSATSYTEITEIRKSRVVIYDEFQDFASLDKYLSITIGRWNRDYPLPSLPSSIIVLLFMGEYKFPLNNLPSSIEVLSFTREYDYPLDNLPINLYQLEFLNYDSEPIYKHPIHFIPESVKILNLNNAINQSSYNLPIKLKKLDFSNNTFKDKIVIYPPELENLYLINDSSSTSHQEDLEKLEKLEQYFNLINLPLSIRVMCLPDLNISNLEIILKRLINLESLFIPEGFNNPILEYPPNLVELHFMGYYKYKLVNLPVSLKYILIGWYDNSLSLEAVANSNIEHIDLDENRHLSIINYLPKSLKKITIIETHTEFNTIKQQYPHLEINKIPDYDYHDAMIDDMRDESW